MDDGDTVEVTRGQPKAKTVVAASEETMEATGGKVLVTPEAMEGLLAGPGNQKVSDEAD